jgi:tetratricopeptide (TPR) repeat protein
MFRVVVAIALLAACRGNPHESAGPSRGSALSVSGSGSAAPSTVPKMPITEDGRALLKGLDTRIAATISEPSQHISYLLLRATLRGHVDDYAKALELSEAYLAANPTDEFALKLRLQALSAVHRFSDARAIVKQLSAKVDRSFVPGLEVGLDQATGNLEAALAKREQLMKDAPGPQNFTLYAMALAEAGRYDDALALLPKATTAVRMNTPEFVNWLLFQWGRIYEQKGDLSIARDFYEEAYKRLPTLETVEHLAATLAATGDRVRAREIIKKGVEENYHPSLRALAVKLGVSKESAADVAAEWERYVAALPLAFSDHAARFYLDVGANPKRALELARVNLTNRATFDARALVVEAALAAGDPAAACAEVEPLVNAPTRAHRFTAWKALSACGRKEEAQRLGAALGI